MGTVSSSSPSSFGAQRDCSEAGAKRTLKPQDPVHRFFSLWAGGRAWTSRSPEDQAFGFREDLS